MSINPCRETLKPLAVHGPENTHIYTGHYTHSGSPDERERAWREREKKDWVACSLLCPFNFHLAVRWWIAITGRAVPPTTGKDTLSLSGEKKAEGAGVWSMSTCAACTVYVSVCCCEVGRPEKRVCEVTCVNIWPHAGHPATADTEVTGEVRGRWMTDAVCKQSTYLMWFCPRSAHNKSAAVKWSDMSDISITPQPRLQIDMKH